MMPVCFSEAHCVGVVCAVATKKRVNLSRTASLARKAEVNIKRVPCPHCSRSFSLQVLSHSISFPRVLMPCVLSCQASERHIPVCANVRSKPRRIQRGSSTLAYMRVKSLRSATV